MIFKRTFYYSNAAIEVHFIHSRFRIDMSKEGDVHLISWFIHTSGNRQGAWIAFQLSNKVARAFGKRFENHHIAYSVFKRDSHIRHTSRQRIAVYLEMRQSYTNKLFTVNIKMVLLRYRFIRTYVPWQAAKVVTRLTWKMIWFMLKFVPSFIYTFSCKRIVNT